MIETISPLVQEARSQWRRTLALHLTGSITGGLATFGLVASVGQRALSGLQSTDRWILAGVAGTVFALKEAGLLKLPLPGMHRSVPQRWWRKWGPYRASLAYGLVLGMGVSTFIPFSGFYLALTWALLSTNPAYGMALGTAYGLARAIPVVVTSYRLAFDSEMGSPRIAARTITRIIVDRKEIAQSWTLMAETAFSSAALLAVVLVGMS